MTNPPISTDGLRRIHVIDFWDTDSNLDQPAYLLEGGQLRLIDHIETNIREDETMDLALVDDDDLHAVDKYAFVIYIDDTPKKSE